MPRRFSGRLIQRTLAVTNGELGCPRSGPHALDACVACQFYCREDRITSSLVCSYPIPARDTLARLARRRHDIRIAMAHHLDRN
jgi:hypothetical protein